MANIAVNASLSPPTRLSCFAGSTTAMASVAGTMSARTITVASRIARG